MGESELDIAQGKTMAETKAALAENNPEVAKNLERVLKIVGRYLNFDENDIYFKNFSGDTVGEATRKGVIIDPIMLMHPANRLAHVLIHEILHAKGDVENDGLVEACTKTLLESSGL